MPNLRPGDVVHLFGSSTCLTVEHVRKEESGEHARVYWLDGSGRLQSGSVPVCCVYVCGQHGKCGGGEVKVGEGKQ